MGGSCSRLAGDEKCLKGEGYSEDFGDDGSIILKWILRKIMLKCLDSIHVAQDRD